MKIIGYSSSRDKQLKKKHIRTSKDSDCDETESPIASRKAENFHPLPIIEHDEGDEKGLKLSANPSAIPFHKNCDLVEINSKYPEQPIAIAIPVLPPAKPQEPHLNYLTAGSSITNSCLSSNVENVFERLLLTPSSVWTGSSSSIESTNTGHSSGASSSNRSPTRAKKRQAPPPPIENPRKHSTSSSHPETTLPQLHYQ